MKPTILFVGLILSCINFCNKNFTYTELNLPENTTFDSATNLPYGSDNVTYVLSIYQIQIDIENGQITGLVNWNENSKLSADKLWGLEDKNFYNPVVNLGKNITIINDLPDNRSSYITYRGNHLNGITLHTRQFKHLRADPKQPYVEKQDIKYIVIF